MAKTFLLNPFVKEVPPPHFMDRFCQKSFWRRPFKHRAITSWSQNSRLWPYKSCPRDAICPQIPLKMRQTLPSIQILTGEDWNVVMYDGIQAYGGVKVSFSWGVFFGWGGGILLASSSTLDRISAISLQLRLKGKLCQTDKVKFEDPALTHLCLPNCL